MVDTNHTIISFIYEKNLPIWLLRLSLIILLLVVNVKVIAQDKTDPIQAYFAKDEIELNRGEMVSNVLKVINTNGVAVPFTIKTNVPARWEVTDISKSDYIADPGDTVYIPIRVVPSERMLGNAKFYINAFVQDENKQSMAHATFYCSTKKVVKWDLTTNYDDDRIYLKNGQEEAALDINLFNSGNYDQDIIMSVKSARSDVVILDSMEEAKLSMVETMTLEPRQDTSYKYKIRGVNGRRNFRTVSLINHLPTDNGNPRTYSVFVQSTEPRQSGENNISKGAKIDFVKLGHQNKVNPFGGAILPLEVTGVAQNILSPNSFMSLNLRGISQLGPDESLVYTTQLNFTSQFYNTQLLARNPWYVGYFTRKYRVQAGLINGGVMGVQNSGKGLRGDYVINKTNEVGAFFVRSPTMFGAAQNEAYGARHEIRFNKGRATSGYMHGVNNVRNLSADIVSTRVTYRFLQNHNVGFLGALSRSNDRNADSTWAGYLIGANYSGKYLKGRLNTSTNGRYNPRTFSTSLTRLIQFNNQTSYFINDKWSSFLNSNYTNTRSFQYIDSTQTFDPINPTVVFFNQAFLSTKMDWGSIQPGLYYNTSNVFGNRVHSRGGVFRVTANNFQRNTLFAGSFIGGYNKAIDYPDIPNYFTLQFSSILRVRTLTLNIRYNYGAIGAGNAVNLVREGISPKFFRAAGQYQYLFKNTRFVFQTNGSYTYNSRFSNHNFNAFPELYYFSKTGWRFNINLSYNISSNNFARGQVVNLAPIGGLNQDGSATVNQNLLVGFGFRREFGIPIPFKEPDNHTVTCIAFFDIDGDKLRSKKEPVIENVVIGYDQYEAITDDEGLATFINLQGKGYRFRAFALDKLDGWFPNIPDSILISKNEQISIPFVRGVKVVGDVVMDREKIALVNESKKFDLSNIKITATGLSGETYSALTDFDGHFEFYMPNGEYTLTLDEKIFNSGRYYLSENNILLDLKDGIEQMYTSFYIIEKKRTIRRKTFGDE